MKFLKGLLAFCLAIILTAAVGIAAGSLAIENALSEKAIEKAIEETDAIEQITDNILRQKTTNMGGEYGTELQTILKSDAMTEFFTEYTRESLNNKIYSDSDTVTVTEIGSDDLYQAFSAGIDECVANGSISLDSGERALLDEALKTSMPDLTQGVNYVMAQMNLTSFIDEETATQLEMIKQVASPEIRYATIGIAIIAALLLIILYWRSKAGVLWTAVCVLLIAGFFYIMAYMVTQTMGSSSAYIALSDRIVAIMASYGLQTTSILVGVIGVALIVILYPIMRLISRNKRKYEQPA